MTAEVEGEGGAREKGLRDDSRDANTRLAVAVPTVALHPQMWEGTAFRTVADNVMPQAVTTLCSSVGHLCEFACMSIRALVERAHSVNNTTSFKALT